jgi:hypothetical protein
VAGWAFWALALEIEKNVEKGTEITTYTTELAFEACQTVFTEVFWASGLVMQLIVARDESKRKNVD